MKTKLLLLAAALVAAPLASAQLTLNTFSAFGPPDAFFVGDWDGDGGGGPRATFSQAAGSYEFAGGLNDDASGAYYFFPVSPGNLAGYGLLELSVRLLAGNTADSFRVSLLNFATGESAGATFLTTDFNSAGFTTVAKALVFSSGFDPGAVDAFLLTGDILGGSDTLSLAIDNLAVASANVVNPPLGAVPEPSTYGLLAAPALAAVVLVRRFKGQRA